MRRWLVAGILLGVVVVLLGRAVDVGAVCAWVTDLQQEGGPGALVFVGLYAAGTFLALPASWFQGGASFLYGPAWGIPLAWGLSVGLGLLCFELARGRLREPILRRFGDSARFSALDRASQDHGLRLVILLRLSPVAPYNAVCYLLGLTAVTRKQYLLGTALGTLIPVFVWGTVGASLTDLAAMVGGEAAGPAWVRLVIVGVTLAASAGVVVFVRRALSAVAPEETAG
jgi:uncharacterized membrane protein YdjX (TVP38/TMEM64 family)